MARAAKKKASKRKTSKKKAIRKTKSAAGRADVPIKSASQPPEAKVGEDVSPLQAIERAFEGFLQRHWRSPMSLEWPQWGEFSSVLGRTLPSVDVMDREKEVVIRAEVPGIDKEDIELSIVDRTLTIEGSSRHEEKEEKDNYVHQEIRSGRLRRSLLLPTDVNASRAKTTFKDGVLELHLPKVKASKRHKISVT